MARYTQTATPSAKLIEELRRYDPKELKKKVNFLPSMKTLAKAIEGKPMAVEMIVSLSSMLHVPIDDAVEKSDLHKVKPNQSFIDLEETHLFLDFPNFGDWVEGGEKSFNYPVREVAAQAFASPIKDAYALMNLLSAGQWLDPEGASQYRPPTFFHKLPEFTVRGPVIEILSDLDGLLRKFDKTASDPSPTTSLGELIEKLEPSKELVASLNALSVQGVHLLGTTISSTVVITAGNSDEGAKQESGARSYCGLGVLL